AKTEAEVPASAADAKKEVETPAPVAEAAVEVQQHETERPEAQHPEIPAAVAAVAVNTTPVTPESGPVDKTHEPTFATVASAPAEAVAAKDKGSESEASEAAEPGP